MTCCPNNAYVANKPVDEYLSKVMEALEKTLALYAVTLTHKEYM